MPHVEAVQIRRLTEHLFRLRLEGLDSEPEAFTESAEEFRQAGREHAARNLAKSEDNNFGVLAGYQCCI